MSAHPRRRGLVGRVALAALTVVAVACEGGRSTSAVEETSGATGLQVRVAIAGDGQGTVQVGPAGTSCSSGQTACAASIAPGTIVTLTATPAPGSSFGGWTGAGCGMAQTCAIAVHAAQQVTASFARATAAQAANVALTVTVTGLGAGAVTSAPAGIACVRANGSTPPNVCEGAFAPSTAVTLTATPATGSTFTGWSGAGAAACAGVGPCVVTPASAQGVTATFAPAAPTTTALTVATAGGGAGVVTSAPTGVSCARATDGTQSGACDASFAIGAEVTLTATPAAGSSFRGWSGAGAAGCTGTASCTLALSAAREVIATFAPAPVALRVVVAGSGGGTVTTAPVTSGGIDCARTTGAAAQDGRCTLDLAPGTVVTLVATAAAGSSFAGWSGGGCTGTGACSVTLREAATVTATFAEVRRALTVATAGQGSGTVSASAGGIACTRTAAAQAREQSGACTATYAEGQTVTLTATPAAGSTFQGWTGGGCSGTGSCVVAMTAAREVTATFGVVPPTVFSLRTTTEGAGAGTITSAPAGVQCVRAAGATSGACGAAFVLGTPVTLTATPAPGSTFAGWTGSGCTGTGPCTVVMTAGLAVTATFAAAPPPPVLLTVSVTGGGGTVTSTPAGINCTRPDGGGAATGACSASFPVGTSVTLTATKTTNSWLSAWQGGAPAGCVSLVTTCTVTMTTAGTAEARFQADFVAPIAGITGVAQGGTYVGHPNLNLSASDDIGLDTPDVFRITQRVARPDGSIRCLTGLNFMNAPTYAASADGTCRAVRIGLTFVSGAGAPAGVYHLTVQAIDKAGHLSTPVVREYTVTN